MLPRRVLRSCVTRNCLAGPSRTPARRLQAVAFSSSALRPKPATQFAEVVDYQPSYHHSSSLPPPPPRPEPIGSTTSFPSRPREPLFIPPPLPADIVPNKNEAQLSLYPSTGVIDSISMISICLRRPELVGRAYAIFNQLVEDARVGLKQMPDADIWSRVIEGVAKSGSDKANGSKARSRAERLVRTWESLHSSLDIGVVAGRHQQGIKVYQGWFAGTVAARQTIEPLEPYIIREPSLVTELLDGVKQSDLPLAYDALIQVAENENMREIAQRVDEFQQIQAARKQRVAEDVVADVSPVMEVSHLFSSIRIGLTM